MTVGRMFAHAPVLVAESTGVTLGPKVKSHTTWQNLLPMCFLGTRGLLLVWQYLVSVTDA
jgi:hypothetical protein